jgi:hypothetical protein
VASVENCIFLTENRIEKPPLRFPDEFVRHKVVDLVGDLVPVGKHDEDFQPARHDSEPVALIGRLGDQDGCSLGLCFRLS